MEKFSFFNDVNGDRVYYAEDFARHLATYFTNGIFNNGCQVLADNNDMSVDVSIGSANINGYRYDNDTVKTLTLDTADGALNRIDSIVIRLDLTNRNITTQLIKGTSAENPVVPALVRNSTIYDLRLAIISIPKGTTTITQDLVTDTRFDSDVCGDVISTVQTPDTHNLFIQIETEFNNLMSLMNSAFNKFNTDSSTALSTFDTVYKKFVSDCDEEIANKITTIDNTFNGKISSYDNTFSSKINSYDATFESKISGYDTSFNNKINFWTTDFNSWFANIKDILDANTAGHLQNEIDAINNKALVEDANYVHTDNNFSNVYKEKIDTNSTNIEKNISNIENIINNGCKSYDITLTMDGWQLDSSDNSYYYNVSKSDISENTSVTISMSRTNKAKFKGLTDVKSFTGGFKITTDEMPEEDIDITVKYMLSNMTIIGGNE